METRWPLLLAKYDLNHSKATLHIPNSLSRHIMSVGCCNWLYQKRRWDQVWPAKSPLECLFSWEYLSWLWQGPFPCYDFDDMMTEPRGIYIVNDLSYGCVFVQAAFLVSLEIYCKLLTGLQFLGGLAHASSIVKARAHTSSHQRTTQTLVIN